jgi:chromosome segregation ATPase
VKPRIAHNPDVEGTLGFAAELERRDAELARSLADVERVQAEVDELRTHGDATRVFLDTFPELIARREGDAEAAGAARAEAEAQVAAADEALAQARKDDQRLEAERQRRQALDAVTDASRWLDQARSAIEAARAEGDEQRAEAKRVAARAHELGPRVRDVSNPGDDLAAALEWAARARGALLLEHSNLVAEREAIIREANELTASVLGDPLVSSAVAGLKDRLALALGQPSP